MLETKIIVQSVYMSVCLSICVKISNWIWTKYSMLLDNVSH